MMGIGMPWRRRILPAAVAILAVAVGLCQARVASAVEAVRPTLVVYATENQAVTRDRPTIGESIVIPQLGKRGYEVLPSLRVPNMNQLCPRDVRGVWKTDRRMSFRKHFRADMLWMASVEYNLHKKVRSRFAGGTVSVVARAFSADTGESLWFGRVANHPLQGTALATSAHQALSEILPKMVADFDRAPAVRRVSAQVSVRQPQPWPAHIPRVTRPSGQDATVRSLQQAPGRSALPYTGVIVQADHLRMQPSFRTEIHTQRGRPIYVPKRDRMTWADNVANARLQAGPHPLVLKALRTEGNHIVLRDSDIRSLKRERHLLERKPPTIVVRPPGH